MEGIENWLFRMVPIKCVMVNKRFIHVLMENCTYCNSRESVRPCELCGVLICHECVWLNGDEELSQKVYECCVDCSWK